MQLRINSCFYFKILKKKNFAKINFIFYHVCVVRIWQRFSMRLAFMWLPSLKFSSNLIAGLLKTGLSRTFLGCFCAVNAWMKSICLLIEVTI